jgi:putative transposase
MSFVRIWVHLVFATKNREPLLKKEFRYDVYQHIIENCHDKEIFLQAINGYTDHLHCLVSLGRDQNIAKVSQLIKGESSFWINKNNLTPEKFTWQDDYFAVSVSESQVEKVINYIKNQERHHSRKSFHEEVEEFIAKHGWETIRNQ